MSQEVYIRDGQLKICVFHRNPIQKHHVERKCGGYCVLIINHEIFYNNVLDNTIDVHSYICTV